MKNIPGVIRAEYDIRDYKIARGENLPVTYTCGPLVPIKDQGSQPTCVAHAAAALIEYHNLRQHGDYTPFSTNYIYGTRGPLQYRGDGMCIKDALANLRTYGDCYYKDCKGNMGVEKAMEAIDERRDELNELAYPHRISTYYRCTTPAEIKTALVTHGPLLISMNTYDGAKIVDDMYTYNAEAEHGRHCVLLYGYNEIGWLIQNSWGPFYAGDGRFILPYDFKINEAWGITDDINDPILIKKNPTPVANFWYKLWNKIANFFINIFKKD